MPEQLNSIVDLKKFFESKDIDLADTRVMDFKKEWQELSEEEKRWFKSQPLE